MKATWEKIETNRVTIDVEVGAEEVARALDQAFKKVAQKVNVPGFRKGKVPRAFFEKRFGVESLYQDAVDILLPDAYRDALLETKLEPVEQPQIDVEHIAAGEPFKFKATFYVKPEVTLGDYKGIVVAASAVEVTDEELDAELDKLRNRHAELIVVEEGAAQQGDTAIIDFEGFVDGVAFDGGKGERHSLELGSGSFIPGFEDQVVGMELGELKDVEVTFPEGYQAEELAGKPAVFKVKLHELKRKQLPELDDEFAKDLSDFDTLEEYKQDLKANLLKNKEHAAKHEREDAIVNQAVENATFELPQPMIDSQVDRLKEDFENRLKQQGLNLDLYFQFSGQTMEQLEEQMLPDAVKRLRTSLVLEAIAAAESIEATEEQLNEELDRLSQQFNRPVEELRSIFTSNGSLESIQSDLAIRKTVDFLVEQSKEA